MLKDIVEPEPKGVSVPLPKPIETVPVPRRHVHKADDRLVPSKRLRSMYRKIVTGLSLKEWAKTLKDAGDQNLINQWYRNKQQRSA